MLFQSWVQSWCCGDPSTWKQRQRVRTFKASPSYIVSLSDMKFCLRKPASPHTPHTPKRWRCGGGAGLQPQHLGDWSRLLSSGQLQPYLKLVWKQKVLNTKWEWAGNSSEHWPSTHKDLSSSLSTVKKLKENWQALVCLLPVPSTEAFNGQNNWVLG